MAVFKHVIPLAAAIALTACEKEINFDYHEIPEQQVIEGLLTAEGVRVRLTKTVATDEPFSSTTVTDATVFVKDHTSDETFILLPDLEGNFTNSTLIGIIGHKYELTVQIGENSYTASSSMLPPSEIVSSEFNWIKMPYDDVAVLKVQFTADKKMQTCYWLRIFRNGEAYEWQAIDGRNAVNGLVTGMIMTSRKDIGEEDDDTVLRDGDVVDIEVMPISREMADYLNSLNNGDYNGNRMFSGPYCLGYFLAAPLSKTKIVYRPEEIPYAG